MSDPYLQVLGLLKQLTIAELNSLRMYDAPRELRTRPRLVEELVEEHSRLVMPDEETAPA
jgi:hypothetical protein